MPAAAADTAEVEALIRQGVELRQQGRDERALPLFQKAHDLAPTPRTAGQLGLAEMATGYWLDAEKHLAKALENPEHPWVAKNLKSLIDALAETRANIGELVVEGSPPGATIAVEGKPVGVLPLPGPIRLAKGKVDVDASAPGYVHNTQSIDVPGGSQQRVTVALEKVAVAVAPLTRAEPPLATTPAHGEEVPVVTTVGEESWTRRRLGYGAAIGGGVVLLGAVVETFVWQSKRSHFNDPSNGCFEDAPMNGASGCSSTLGSLHTAETLSIVGYSLAGALGVTSAVLLLTDGVGAESRGSRVACAPGLGLAQMSCRLVF
jgi:hypothetical protein